METLPSHPETQWGSDLSFRGRLMRRFVFAAYGLASNGAIAETTLSFDCTPSVSPSLSDRDPEISLILYWSVRSTLSPLALTWVIRQRVPLMAIEVLTTLSPLRLRRPRLSPLRPRLRRLSLRLSLRQHLSHRLTSTRPLYRSLIFLR